LRSPEANRSFAAFAEEVDFAFAFRGFAMDFGSSSLIKGTNR